MKIEGKELNVSADGIDHKCKVEPDEAEIAQAMLILPRWLDCAPQWWHSAGSYGVKHKVEERCGIYISNGALIVAASRLHIAMKWQPGWKNTTLSMRTPPPLQYGDPVRTLVAQRREWDAQGRVSKRDAADQMIYQLDKVRRK